MVSDAIVCRRWPRRGMLGDMAEAAVAKGDIGLFTEILPSLEACSVIGDRIWTADDLLL